MWFVNTKRIRAFNMYIPFPLHVVYNIFFLYFIITKSAMKTKIESMSENAYFKISPGAIEDIRKSYDLDKSGRLEDALKIMSEWILKQDHIIKKDFSKGYLERTLIACKGSVERAKKQIDRLCTLKTLIPKFFTKTNVKKELQHISDIAWSFPLPTQTEDYYRILLLKANNNKNFKPENLLDFFQYEVILNEYSKAHDYSRGVILIHDYTDINLMEMLPKWNSVETQQFSSIIRNGYGTRLKSFNILSNSTTIDLLMKIINQLAPGKVRINVHKTLEDLHKVVTKELLPIEYGGNERSFKELYEEWIDAISSEEHVEYMKMMHKAGSDETKRHAGTFNEEYMGMPGSFRCLCVD